jgi:fructose-specific phosphotransferase system IIC component
MGVCLAGLSTEDHRMEDSVQPASDLFFVGVRCASALIVTVMAAWLTFQLVRGRLAPAVAWVYAASIMWLESAYRWFIVWLLTECGADLYAFLQPWTQPMAQTMQVLLGMVIVVLTYSHIKSRAQHHRQFHPDEPTDA